MTGAEIKALREAAGLSQQDLAERLGVAVETVSRWENGRLGFRKMSELALKAALKGGK
jgi:DNA-binding transcriptional regulator YiaG